MLTVEVCIGSACHLKGAYEVVSIFENLAKKIILIIKLKKDMRMILKLFMT